ncbi:unnamed protein product [Schistosoma margrebowiei]|uniref:Uncharacterized protein n=1 Tax=Schistosoma margrebowiei TaxID=48269 RepID=A0A183LDV0_9TREM|nr:unnamed protein product [Schistosoma margrebowiei]
MVYVTSNAILRSCLTEAINKISYGYYTVDIPWNLSYYLQSPMNMFHSPNSAPNSKHILPTTSDVPLNGTDTFISDNSQNIMTRLNNSTDSHTDSSSSVPFCNSPTELFINVSSSYPPRLTTTTKKTMFVRALFDYDPNMDTGLPGRDQYPFVLGVMVIRRDTYDQLIYACLATTYHNN